MTHAPGLFLSMWDTRPLLMPSQMGGGISATVSDSPTVSVTRYQMLGGRFDADT